MTDKRKLEILAELIALINTYMEFNDKCMILQVRILRFKKFLYDEEISIERLYDEVHDICIKDCEHVKNIKIKTATDLRINKIKDELLESVPNYFEKF